MPVEIIIIDKNLTSIKSEFKDENIEILVNSADKISIDIDINLIKLKVINNKNLQLTFANNKTILLQNFVPHVFQNEIQEDNITTVGFLFNVEENMNYIIDSMKTMFDAIDFTSKNFNKFDTSSISLEKENKEILFNEEEFLKNKDELFKNTKNNDLIFYDELVNENK